MTSASLPEAGGGEFNTAHPPTPSLVVMAAVITSPIFPSANEGHLRQLTGTRCSVDYLGWLDLLMPPLLLVNALSHSVQGNEVQLTAEFWKVFSRKIRILWLF